MPNFLSLLGNAASGIGSLFTGNKGYNTQLPTRSPEATGAFNQLLQPTVNRLQDNQTNIEPIIDKSRQDFRRQTLPLISGKYSAFGNENTPAAQYALSNAAAEHESGLAGLRAQYGLQQRGLDQNLLSLITQPSHSNVYSEPTQGILGAATPGIFDAATKGLGNYFGSNNKKAKADEEPENRLGGQGSSANQQSEDNASNDWTQQLAMQLFNYLIG